MTGASGGTLRWLYHAATREAWDQALAADPYGPREAHGEAGAREGFVHASYRDVVVESARLYLPAGSAKVIVQIDPRLVAGLVRVAETPRGPMPHVHGGIPRRAITRVVDLESFARDRGAWPDECKV
jgi:uncharacterized protein (DUF952 family)